MSFYGNVFYELQNAFSKMIVKHKYNEDATTAMTVVGLDGQITMAPNNEWITLTADPETVRCGITHKEIEAAGSADTFNQAPKNAAPVTTLSFEEPFKSVVIDYDKAGHVTGVTEQYLKLPISDTDAHIKHTSDADDTTTLVIKGIDGEFTLAPNNKWIELTADEDEVICGITHVIAEDNGSDKPIIALDPDEGVVDGVFAEGQTFKVPTVTYDEAGHITGVEYNEYSLPIRDYDADLTTMQEDIATLQKEVADHENRITEIEDKIDEYDALQDALNDFTDEMGPRMDEVERVNEEQQKILDWVGKKEDLFSDKDLADLEEDEELDPENKVTITNTIGCISEAVKALKMDVEPDDEGNSEEEANIAGCLKHLNNDCIAVKDQTVANLSYLKGIIRDLCTILNAYDLGINIDIESLLKET